MSRLLMMFPLWALACTGVPPQAIRDWASPNFKHYRQLVDQKYPSEDSKPTRLHAYQSMAALICDADTADKKDGESSACQCEKATTDADLEKSCTVFIQNYGN